MALVPTIQLLKKAQKGGYAVGAFNTSNLEFTQAIIRAACHLNAPVIVQASEKAIRYASTTQLSFITRIQAFQTKKAKVALHLDHGQNPKIIRNAIHKGFTSIMIDASHNKFNKNVAISKKYIDLAHQHGLSAEAELGTLGGVEDNIKNRVHLTDPDEAVEFVKKTNVDFLAVAIGTSHGAYKFKGKSNLDFKRLKEIRELLEQKRKNIPLVLHGASTVPAKLVKLANKYGAKLKQTHGVSTQHLKKAVKLGICKVNTDTDLRIAFDAGIRRYLKQKPKSIDARDMLTSATELVQKTVEDKIKILGSDGEA